MLFHLPPSASASRDGLRMTSLTIPYRKTPRTRSCARSPGRRSPPERQRMRERLRVVPLCSQSIATVHWSVGRCSTNQISLCRKVRRTSHLPCLRRDVRHRRLRRRHQLCTRGKISQTLETSCSKGWDGRKGPVWVWKGKAVSIQCAYCRFCFLVIARC